MKRVFILIIFSILLFGCGGAETSPNLISAKVERVVSGQTLEISAITLTEANASKPPSGVCAYALLPPKAIALENAERVTKVRIIGIDAPDLRQSPWGEAAKQRLGELLGRDYIQLETETPTTDSYDRLLAHVWHNGTLISEQLVREGYVLADTKYSHKYSQRLLNAREYARLLGYGIWNPEQPMRQTPSQFRQASPS